MKTYCTHEYFFFSLSSYTVIENIKRDYHFVYITSTYELAVFTL